MCKMQMLLRTKICILPTYTST